jgi:hypothetical protein
MAKKKTVRQCQPCTACCDGWVQMTIGDAHVYPGHPCPHSTDNGCDDYENRPVDPCRNFICGWVVEGSPLPDWLKPDNGKVIVIFNKIQWQGVPVDVAVPVGKRIPPRSLKWLQEFAQKHGRPLLYAEQIIVDGVMQPEQDFIGYGPPAFQAYVQERKAKNLKLW